MNWKETRRWLFGVTLGGLLGFLVLLGISLLSCLAYLGRESYCSGEKPFVGFFLVAVAPLAILIGAVLAGKRIAAQSLQEALQREAERYTGGDEPPWSPDSEEPIVIPGVTPDPAASVDGDAATDAAPSVARPVRPDPAPTPSTEPRAQPVGVPLATVRVNFLDPTVCEAFIKGSFVDKPERLQHILVVAERVRQSAREINDLHSGISIDEVKAYCAALVHDIGYLEAIAEKGFHPLDGYVFLTRSGFPQLAELVIGHSSSPEESELLGFGPMKYSTGLISELITYWDMHVMPGGAVVSYEERIADILERFGADSPTGRATLKAKPRIEEIIAKVRRLTHYVAP